MSTWRSSLEKDRALASVLRALGALVLLCGAMTCAATPPSDPHVTVPRVEGAGAAVSQAPGPRPESGTAIPVTADDPSQGDALALVTLVEWGDLEDPFTEKLVDRIRGLQRLYGKDKLRVVWKHNPLNFHKNARPAHLAAQTVFKLGGSTAFWAFHARAFENRKDLTQENFEKWAVQAGVSADAFKGSLGHREHEAKIDADMTAGAAAGVTGTPASFINGVLLSGAQPIEKLREVIDAKLAEAKVALRSGVPRERLYAELSDKNAKANPPKKAPDGLAPPEDTTTVWRVPIGGSPSLGKQTALVTIVEFSDFQDPFSRKAKATVDALLAEYGDNLRLVSKASPLPFHKRAEPAAQCALEARAQKGDAGFWKAFELLFENQANLSDQDLEAYAKTLGLDVGRAAKAIASHKHTAALEADEELADELKVTGTPRFFINGRSLRGSHPIEKFKAIIDEEIGRAKDALKSGTPAAKIYETLQARARAPEPLTRIVLPRPTKAQPGKGAANAKVVVQVFADYECPFCKRAMRTTDELLAAFPGQVRLVFRHHPLSVHRNAHLAAEAAVEVFEQKGEAAFWKMGGMLYDDMPKPGIERPRLEERAAELGVDMKRFKAALDSRKHEATVDADIAIAEKAGISGTPVIAINDYFVSGAASLATLKSRVRKALGPYEPIQPSSLLGAPRPAAPAAVPGMFRAKHLLVMFKGSRRGTPTITRTREEARARAEEALRKAKAGARFEDLVTVYSDEPGGSVRGGDLGRFPKGAMVPAFEQAVEQAAVGSITSAETPFGFHVILRLE